MLREPVVVLDAERVGIDALAFLASHDDLMRRFLELSGLEVDRIRQEARRPVFLVGVYVAAGDGRAGAEPAREGGRDRRRRLCGLT